MFALHFCGLCCYLNFSYLCRALPSSYQASSRPLSHIMRQMRWLPKWRNSSRRTIPVEQSALFSKPWKGYESMLHGLNETCHALRHFYRILSKPVSVDWLSCAKAWKMLITNIKILKLKFLRPCKSGYNFNKLISCTYVM